jgi:branched-chain amino acid transport system permease protein
MTSGLTPRAAITLALFLALAVLPMIVPARGGIFFINFGTAVMILAIAAMSLDLLLGFGGMVSFGHAAYIGTGGYAVAVLSFYGIDDGWLQFALAVIGSGIVAALIGLVALRTRGVYFIMITLGITQMLYYVGISLDAFGGDNGFSTNRSIFAPGVTLADPLTLYYVSFVLLVLVMFGLQRAVNARFGMALRAAKSNERRARSLGFAPTPYKLLAFVIAGMVCGLAGALYVNLRGFMTPDYMQWMRSGDLLVMLLIGGQQSFLGALIGSGVFHGVETFLPSAIDAVLPNQGRNWQALFGPLLILLVLFFKGGIVGTVPRRWREFRMPFARER